MKGSYGSEIAIHRSKRGWSWAVITGEESIATGKSNTWRKAREDARIARNYWIAEAYRMIVPGKPLLKIQRDLMEKFSSSSAQATHGKYLLENEIEKDKYNQQTKEAR